MSVIYEVSKEKSIKNLLNNIEIFGLTILGDGAIVKRMPLINIIVSGVYCPVEILAIFY